MRKKIGVLCLLLGSLFLRDLLLVSGRDGNAFDGSFSLCLASEGAPFAEIDESTHDLGKIRLEGTYEHSFVIRNSGTGTLEITKVTVG